MHTRLDPICVGSVGVLSTKISELRRKFIKAALSVGYTSPHPSSFLPDLYLSVFAAVVICKLAALVIEAKNKRSKGREEEEKNNKMNSHFFFYLCLFFVSVCCCRELIDCFKLDVPEKKLGLFCFSKKKKREIKCDVILRLSALRGGGGGSTKKIPQGSFWVI